MQLRGTWLFLWQSVIAFFFFWHAIAIGVYALPTEATDVTTNYFRDTITPYVSPYVLATSQWQQWNLFSPDPLRRITHYRISFEDEDGSWHELMMIDDKTFAWWEHALQFKFLSHILVPEQEAIALHYLQHFCHWDGLEPGTTLRLESLYSIIPFADIPQSVSSWQQWSPDFGIDWMIEDSCPIE